MLRRFAPLAVLLPTLAVAQPAERLTVDLIAQDPETWIGDWPEDVFWTDAGDYVYFTWNPRGAFPSDSLFRAPRAGGEPEVVPAADRRRLPPRFDGWHADRLAYDRGFRHHVFARDGDLWLYEIPAGRLRRLTATSESEADPRFAPGDPQRVVFVRDDNLFALDLSGGGALVEQLTDIRSGGPDSDATADAQDGFLERQQLELFDVLRERARLDSLREAAEEQEEAARDVPPTLYTGQKRVQGLSLSPDERFVTLVLAEVVPPKPTSMTDYVTRTGYAEELSARPKVGAAGSSYELVLQDLERDTSYTVDLRALPGATAAADFQRERGQEADSARTLVPVGPYWSPKPAPAEAGGRYAVVDVRTRDNKDRWIVRLDAEAGTVTALHHDRDEAWIAGPGISWWVGQSDVGWMPDGETFWFHSEADGYSHLYAVDVPTGEVRQLTSGAFEVSDARLSKDGAWWVFQSSEGSPFERHYYRMAAEGGERDRITRLPGRNDAALSPDDELLAILNSRSNRPPEVFIEPLFVGESGAQVAPLSGRQAPIRQVTNSTTDAWRAHGWIEPEIVTLPASDGAAVPARIYRPEDFGAEPNGAAVFFVHGAGYLQNVHNWWSSYFREYQFHHLLAQRGYLVLDLDYRASAGYGRDWRTAVYRHMGGRDLQDYVDASRWVGSEFGIPPERVAIYGGSYGGFLTLMALFTEPEHFGSGAALRSVTDWAHYNDVYTSNILNYPAEDSLAFARSSPINFAEGLEDPLLMTHGLVDTNVQPQDIFRLSQRLIELGKRDWELALAPVEPHSYTEPTSWADKLHRILDLIEHTVGPHRMAGDETEG